jgi:hypothetical protein
MALDNRKSTLPLKATHEARRKAHLKAPRKAHSKVHSRACSKASLEAQFKAPFRAHSEAYFKASRKARLKARGEVQSRAQPEPQPRPQPKPQPKLQPKPHSITAQGAVSSPYPIWGICGSGSPLPGPQRLLPRGRVSSSTSTLWSLPASTVSCRGPAGRLALRPRAEWSGRSRWWRSTSSKTTPIATGPTSRLPAISGIRTPAPC